MTSARYSPQQLQAFAATYRRDGVVHVPGLLAPEWVARLTRVIQQARVELAEDQPTVPTIGRHESAARMKSKYPTAEYSYAPGRFTIRWLWRDVDDVRRFFTDTGVAPVVAAILGAKRLQYWYDLTFIHDPQADGAGSPWHHDIAAFPCKGEQIPSQSMSPLQCIRGSHRNPTMFRPPVYVDPKVTPPAGYGEMPDVEAKIASGEYERITWDVTAGDALLIHPYTLHGAPSNLSDKPRIAFTTRWAGDDVRWQPDAFSMLVPGVDLATVPVGQRPDGPLFPYAL
jgi:hypothetical protein